MLAYITWDVSPYIFQLDSFALPWYSILFASGFVFGYHLMKRDFVKRDGLDKEFADRLLIYVILGTFLGARIGHCLFYEWDYYSVRPWEIFIPYSNGQFGFRGLASHGGAIGITIALYLFHRKHKKPFLWLLDRLAVVTALGGGFIRLGNLMNSEIVGKVTDVAWAFRFVRADGPLAFPRHPAQLYEALCYFAIFGLLWWLFQKRREHVPQGAFIGLFFTLVFTVRFFMEFIKADQALFEQNMTLNMGQLLSIPFVVGGIGLMTYAYQRKKAS